MEPDTNKTCEFRHKIQTLKNTHRLPERHEHDRLNCDEFRARSEGLQILAGGHVKPDEAVEGGQLREVLQQCNVDVALGPVDLALAITAGCGRGSKSQTKQ